MTDLDTIKKTARVAAKDVRAVAAGCLPNAGEKLRDVVVAHLGHLGIGDGALIVSGYWPIGSEIDPLPLMSALIERGYETALPVVTGPEQPLAFKLWRPGDALVRAAFGTSVPADDAEAVDPDVLMVPMLSFDTRGYRLGYGGGFYDRTIAKLRGNKSITTIGLAFSAQRVDTVPTGSFDLPLDWIATEAGILAGTEDSTERLSE